MNTNAAMNFTGQVQLRESQNCEKPKFIFVT